jgi:hypothetical protein
MSNFSLFIVIVDYSRDAAFMPSEVGLKDEHRTSNVQHRMLNEKNDDEANVAS